MKSSLFVLLSLIICVIGGSALAQDEVECEAGTRPIEHTLGVTCIPENPERIAPLDMTIVELLLITDNPPIISSSFAFEAYASMHPELEDVYGELMETTIDVGFPPNIESVLNAAPDLIIIPSDMFAELLFPRLNEIAPTIVIESTPGDWRSRLIYAGEVLGLSETVDELLADYDVRVNEFRELMGDEAANTEVSLVRTWPGQIGLVVAGTGAASVVEEAGLSRPESQAVDYEYVMENLNTRPEIMISEEELDLADGDVILIFGDPTELTENPVWNALPAVQEGRAHNVGYYWWGDSLLSAHDMLDDLFQYVAETEPENPNPFEDGFDPTDEEESTDE